MKRVQVAVVAILVAVLAMSHGAGVLSVSRDEWELSLLLPPLCVPPPPPGRRLLLALPPAPTFSSPVAAVAACCERALEAPCV